MKRKSRRPDLLDVLEAMVHTADVVNHLGNTKDQKGFIHMIVRSRSVLRDLQNAR